jgi:hypothetical protein
MCMPPSQVCVPWCRDAPVPQGPGGQQRRRQEKLRQVLDSDDEMQEAATEEVCAYLLCRSSSVDGYVPQLPVAASSARGAAVHEDVCMRAGGGER